MTMAIKTTLPLFILVILSGPVLTFSSQATDVTNLLKFKDSLQNVGIQLSNWTSSIPPCKEDSTPQWERIICEGANVWGLKLDNMGLKGTINLDALKELSNLRTLSLVNNSFEGPLPEIKKLGYMKTIFLSNNNFEGVIPRNAFEDMQSLKKLRLDDNKFVGNIPNSLITLGKLTELRLENNQFSGQIPDFAKNRLIIFNVSNNNLQGHVPFNLSHMGASSFSGNKQLCGSPLHECHFESATPMISPDIIMQMVVVVVFALAAIGYVIIILLRPKPNVDSKKNIGVLPIQHKKNVALLPNSSGNHDSDGLLEKSKTLTFLRNDWEKFDMNDLLNASAEMLDKGVIGSSYKATITGKSTVVVKRYRQMHNVDKEEFYQHMKSLGKLNHMNLISLVAFCYKKEEKLLVSDHIDNVSLATYLHGNKSRGQLTLDWPTRLNIMRGVAKGLMYLYNELPGLTVPHGHLKSSNVLVSPSTLEPVLTDYGLSPLINQEHAKETMIAYKSPEYKRTGRINKKTDIWSFGILMLEMITGKIPTNSRQQGRGNERGIKIWVETMCKDGEWNKEVFDKDMKGIEGCEEEIIHILEIALICCDDEVDKRWDIEGVIEKLR